MCSYYGHISKRPVLDLHVPPGLLDVGFCLVTEKVVILAFFLLYLHDD